MYTKSPSLRRKGEWIFRFKFGKLQVVIRRKSDRHNGHDESEESKGSHVKFTSEIDLHSVKMNHAETQERIDNQRSPVKIAKKPCLQNDGRNKRTKNG